MTSIDKFEDHCWKDVIPEADIKLYAGWRRETFVGPRPALLAIDLYDVAVGRRSHQSGCAGFHAGRHYDGKTRRGIDELKRAEDTPVNVFNDALRRQFGPLMRDAGPQLLLAANAQLVQQTRRAQEALLRQFRASNPNCPACFADPCCATGPAGPPPVRAVSISDVAAQMRQQMLLMRQQIDAHNTFISSLSDVLNSGISNLVDADMAAESAQLQALQVRQQLGVQALSIANTGPQIILQLFK